MGVKNLWDILESCKKILPLHHLQNKRLCIDLSCWMVQLQTVNKSHCPTKDKVYLLALFHRLRALIALNCSLIFVTDGSIPAIKLSTYRRRLKLGSEVGKHELNSCKVPSLQRNMRSEFSRTIKEAKLLGAALGIPCLDGIEEAEAQCALLSYESLCDGCFTSDSDIFLFGARTVYRDIFVGEGGYVVCYEMTDIEKELGFGRDSLITLAILLGGDYSHGVYGFGPESACRIVKSIGDSAVLQHIVSEGLPLARKSKSLKKHEHIFEGNCSIHETDNNGSKCHLKRDNQYMEVINAYLKPKCHSADSGTVRRVLALYPFQRSKLQQICLQYFEWPPEKTDEYILPKLAERELRRFANLRFVLSELGVQLPLDEMPVKCPIHEIVNHRKVQGRGCFKISWEEMEGIKSSVVPADLVESACPEKIMEFEQRRAQGKQQNHCRPRTKKSEKTSVNDINQKVQELLLDIEEESTTMLKAFSSTGTIMKETSCISHIDESDEGLLLDSFSKCEAERSAEQGCNSMATIASAAEKEVVDLLSPSPAIHAQEAYSENEAERSDDQGCNSMVTAPSAAEKEVIDLPSPSPGIHARNALKCKANVQCIDVIDPSESETEKSPKHARKARSLRLFLADIKKYIWSFFTQ